MYDEGHFGAVNVMESICEHMSAPAFIIFATVTGMPLKRTKTCMVLQGNTYYNLSIIYY